MNLPPRRSQRRFFLPIAGWILGCAWGTPLAAFELAEKTCDRFRPAAMEEALLEQQLDPEDRAEMVREARTRLGALARFRGLHVDGAVTVKFRDREWFRAYIKNKLEKKYPTERREGYQEAMVWLGLLSPEPDWLESQAKAWAADIRGLYDPERNVLLLAEGLVPEQLDASLTHELVHVLQKRVFENRTPPRPVGDGNLDLEMALDCLREGEAVALTSAFRAAQGVEDEQKKAEDLEKWFREHRILENGRRRAVGCPERLTEYGDFPYHQGAVFVQKTAQKEGWSSVDRWWEDPPRSTDEILHPGRKRETPKIPTLPVLSNGPFRGGVCRWEGTLGSCGWILSLTPRIGEKAARSAVEGWRGDRVGFWSGPGGTWRGLVGQANFQDENSARFFAEALRTAHRDKWPRTTLLRHGIRKSTGGSGEAVCTWVGSVRTVVLWVEGFDASRISDVRDRLLRNPLP